MGGRLLDWLGAGNSAALPDPVTDMPSRIVPGSVALYFATNTKHLYLYDESTPAWYDVDLPTLATFSTESIQDMIAAFLTNDAGITLTYDDAGNLLHIGCSITQYTDEMAQDALAAAFAAGTQTNITVTYNDSTNSFDFSVPIQYTNENAMDAIAAMLAAGTHTGIDVTYNDAGDAMSLRNSRFLVPFWFESGPTSNEVLGRYIATDAFTLPANLSTSKGTVATAPAADFVITIAQQVNATGAFTDIATITIHNDGSITFATTGGTAKDIAVNDVLRIKAQATVDATIQGGAFNIRGQ